MPLASRTYKEAIYSSSPMDKVMKKLLLLKAALRTWNKEVFENVNRRLADSLEHLRGVHDISMNDFSKDDTKNTEIKAEIDSCFLIRSFLINLVLNGLGKEIETSFSMLS